MKASLVSQLPKSFGRGFGRLSCPKRALCFQNHFLSNSSDAAGLGFMVSVGYEKFYVRLQEQDFSAEKSNFRLSYMVREYSEVILHNVLNIPFPLSSESARSC